MVLALLFEGIVVLALLTLGPTIVRYKDSAITTFSIESVPDPAPTPAEPEAQEPQPAETQRAAETAPPPPDEPEPVEELPAPLPPPLVELSSDQMAAADITRMPPARPAQTRKPAVSGPPNIGAVGDSQRVDGQGPNGEPLYAAAWYREPYDDELRGYLSTARGPGWGMIACRTVPDFRVEDCVAVDEYPAGSNMTRAILAAAWQFRVRPPRVGGRVMVGEWVRIRIDYDSRPR